MPTVMLTRGDDGKLAGVNDREQRKYVKFLNRAVNLTPEDSIKFSWTEPRSGPYHRRHFSMIGAVYLAQEQFDDEDAFRKWLEVGAGYCKFVPGPSGRMVALPDSIAYDKLDQAEFEPIHEAVFQFVRSPYARSFLWGHLTDQQSNDMVDGVLQEFA